MNILAFNPGGNSLKAQLVRCGSGQRYAFEAQTLFSISIEGIGKMPKLSRLSGKKEITTETLVAESYGQAAASLLKWWEFHARLDQLPQLSCLDAIAVRVVHGARDFEKPALIDARVVEKIVELEKLAPLHNKSSVEILEPIRCRFPKTPVYAGFDTAFHRTLPVYASTYAIPLDLAKRHQIRRYGFHGISHRYLLERYAHLVGRKPEDCNVVSMHLESGCSVTAIEQGTGPSTIRWVSLHWKD